MAATMEVQSMRTNPMSCICILTAFSIVFNAQYGPLTVADSGFVLWPKYANTCQLAAALPRPSPADRLPSYQPNSCRPQQSHNCRGASTQIQTMRILHRCGHRRRRREGASPSPSPSLASTLGPQPHACGVKMAMGQNPNRTPSEHPIQSNH